jgi:cytochrome c oxidase assembly protein subunit 15
MVGGVFYEHGHRLVAGVVAILTALLALLAWRWEPRPWVRRLAWGALALVLLQALLGGLTVIYLLPVAVSVAHAGVANIFFCLTVTLAVVTAPAGGRSSARPAQAGAPRGWPLLAGLFYAQMLLGALMRHTGAGLAIPDFPLAFGRLLPPLHAWPVIIHFAHRVGALVVVIAACLVVARSLPWRRRPAPAALPAALLALLLPAQVVLGAFTVWSGKGALITSSHVLVGTLCLGTSVWGALRSRRGGQATAAPDGGVRAVRTALEGGMA